MNRPTAGRGPAMPHLYILLALLWLAGAAMRMPLLVVPPILPLIHDDLQMSETQVGALIGMPLTMFALAAVPGSLLIARFGVTRVAFAGLLITALAAAARGAAFDIWTLYAATVLMGFGIAILQPAMPTLVRAWAPRRMWLATAIYTNGMMIGVTLGPTLTIPLVLPLVGGNWRRDLLVWAVPGLIAALAFAAFALRPQARGPGRRGAEALVAGLEQSAALAARPHARHQQRAVLRRQRLRAGLPHQRRPRRPDRHDARLAQRLTARRIVFHAGDERKPATQKLAVHDLRPAHGAGPDRRRCSATESGSRCRRR